VSGTCDLPMTDAGQAAIERHRQALASHRDQPGEWRAAYPAMVSAIIEAYARRQRLTRDTILAATAGSERAAADVHPALSSSLPGADSAVVTFWTDAPAGPPQYRAAAQGTGDLHQPGSV